MNSVREWLVGASGDCDIVIDRPAVSARHCRIRQQDGAFVLEDLGSTNGTYVNGQRVAGSVAVHPNDAITLGRTTSLPFPADAPRVHRIGRAIDNDIVLNAASVSAYHAELIEQAGEYRLKDLDSLNGVAVGARDAKIKETNLTTEDVVYFGDLRVLARELIHGVPDKTALASNSAPPQAAPVKGWETRQGMSRWGWLAVGGAIAAMTLSAGFFVVSLIVVAGMTPPVPGDADASPATSQSAGALGVAAQAAADVKLPAEAPPAETPPPSRAIYTLMVSNSDDSEVFQVATAWAIQPKVMITSAAAVKALNEELANEFPLAFVASPDDPQRLEVVSSTVHPEFEKAWRDGQQARARYQALHNQLSNPDENAPPPDQLKQQLLDLYERVVLSMERQACFDVGVLRLRQPASYVLALAVDDVRSRKVALHARPFPQDSPLLEATPPAAVSYECRNQGYVVATPSKVRRLTASFVGDAPATMSLFGSPLLGQGGEVIGLFSRTTPNYARSNSADAPPTFDVTLAQRIQETLALATGDEQ